MQINLKGLVASKYGSAEAFAKAMNWSGRKARSIISGRQKPSVTDIEKIANALELTSVDRFMEIFFPNIVQKVDIMGRV